MGKAGGKKAAPAMQVVQAAEALAAAHREKNIIFEYKFGVSTSMASPTPGPVMRDALAWFGIL